MLTTPSSVNASGRCLRAVFLSGEVSIRPPLPVRSSQRPPIENTRNRRHVFSAVEEDDFACGDDDEG